MTAGAHPSISHLISQVAVVFLVLASYRLLKPVNKEHAVLMAVLALLGIPIAFLNEVNNLAALRLLSSADDGRSPRLNSVVTSGPTATGTFYAP